jgi:hypothetical protein
MFKELKYYGEIWLPENENEKCFCVLEFVKGEIYLETNLPSKRGYKLELLYGAFNGLGYLTFVNNRISFSSTGVINVSKYNPKYTLISDGSHFIDPILLKAKKFKIHNDVFNSWIRSFHTINDDNKGLTKADDIRHEIQVKEDLKIEIIKSANFNTGINSASLINVGLVSFTSEKELSIMECIDFYKTFQKFLLFFYGKSNHFEYFRLQCLDCDDWYSLYYKESLVKDNSGNLVALDYNDLKDDLSELMKNWYINEDVKFCTDIILENLLSVKVSHSRRFTNSLSAFEAFSKRFGLKVQKQTFEKRLKDKKDLFSEIANINEVELDIFISKIIRTRDFYVHGNKKQTNHFSEFELLYISFLLDFIVCIGLSEELGLSPINIEKIKGRAKSVYLDMQSVNKMLNENNFIN